MTNTESKLWHKIRTFRFDKPNVRLTFAKRLAKENAISRDFAEQIIDEYRKFIFLCCVSREPIAPSHFVDLAWHLHLTYTRSYWTDLCANTLNRDLHHDPTEGGPEEDLKFKNLYKRTLKLYELYFLSKAPEAVWPKENEEPRRQIDLEKKRYWTIRKPGFSFDRRKNLLSVVGIIFTALLLGCSSYVESLAIGGFLVLVMVMVALVATRIKRQNKGDNASGCGSGCGSDGGDSSGGGDSGCSSGCSGGCGGGD